MKLVFKTTVSAITSSTFFIMKKKDGGIVLHYSSKDEKNMLECNKCVMNNSVKEFNLDASGTCNFCREWELKKNNHLNFFK